MEKHRNIVIFVMGRPGSGKDTQADFLAKHFNLRRIITSDLIQEKFLNFPDDLVVKQEKKLFDSGILNTPSWIIEIVKERITELKNNNFDGGFGIIFSGSPRTFYEAETLVPFLEELFGAENMKAIYLDITDEEGIKRILRRAARELDKDPEKLKVRMKEYEERTKPVIDFFSHKNILVTIKGMPSPENIFDDILVQLKDFLI